MKEWKVSEKEAQKMTRYGAISVNMVTGEASHVSDRAPEQTESAETNYDSSKPSCRKTKRWSVKNEKNDNA